MPGGMIGCYLEPRLRFTSSTRGCWTIWDMSAKRSSGSNPGFLLNCIYPEDRQNMQADVFQQIEERRVCGGIPDAEEGWHLYLGT
ncbi:MAG: hypothetical protein ACLVJO_01410 [[Clostridium] scindens]